MKTSTPCQIVVILVFSVFLGISSLVVRSQTISVKTYKGIDCDRDKMAQHFNITTDTCYHDRISGTFHSFYCRRDPTALCFFGDGALDAWCRTQASRDAMRCGSCTATDAYDCTSESVVWYTNCANGLGCKTPKANCSKPHIIPVQKCIKNPVGSYWLKMGPLRPCGLLVVARTYVAPPGARGSGCLGGDNTVLEQAVPSDFCAAGTPNGFDGVSRRLSCNVLEGEEEGGRRGASSLSVISKELPIDLPIDFASLMNRK